MSTHHNVEYIVLNTYHTICAILHLNYNTYYYNGISNRLPQQPQQYHLKLLLLLLVLLVLLLLPLERTLLLVSLLKELEKPKLELLLEGQSQEL